MTLCVRKTALRGALAGLLALGMAPALSATAQAQPPWPLYCGPPGMICGTVVVPFVPPIHKCEPITTPQARAWCPEGSASSSEPGAEPAPEQFFDPKTRFQIRPLKCPLDFIQVGTTFYGGTQCAPPIQPPSPPPARFALPWPTILGGPAAKGTDQPAAATSEPTTAEATPGGTWTPPPRRQRINFQTSDEELSSADTAAIAAARRDDPIFRLFKRLLPYALAISGGPGLALEYWPIVKGPLW